MTEEQKMARRISAESGHIKWIKDHCLRTRDGDEDYVFISYKSDDFERVLDDIVYETCRKYGLRVYFDTAFDDDSDSWITQFLANMSSAKCKAFIAFLDDAYCSSYACLMEMMARKTKRAGGDYEKDSLFFLPINIGSISFINDDSNTGLGTRRFKDGRMNIHAEEELEVFNMLFEELKRDDLEMKDYYDPDKTEVYVEAAAGSSKTIPLTISQCRGLMMRVMPKKNDNDGSNKGFAEVIHDKLVNSGLSSVFSCSTDPDPLQVTVRFITDGAVEAVTVEKGSKLSRPAEPPKEGHIFQGWYCAAGGREQKWDFERDAAVSDIELHARWEPSLPLSGTISLTDFLKEYDNNTFKKDTYSKFRLVGADGYEKYSTEYCDSAFDLAWGFVMKLLAERGEAFIRDVSERHPGLKNPVFIKKDIYEGRQDQNRYRRLEVQGLEEYYMYRHYGQYQWIDAVLKPRLLEFGLPIDKFCFAYMTGDESGEGAAGKAQDAPKPDSVDRETDNGTEAGNGRITGPEPLRKKEPPRKITGRYGLREFLKTYDSKSFQSKSCQHIKLIGVNGCEKYSADKNADGKAFETARQLVFHFAMKRIDEMGMAYIETVNRDVSGSNPIFITQEQHRARMEGSQRNVSYAAVTSKAVSGYSMCMHYSEYDWLRNSLVKQLNALKLPQEDFYLEFD